MSDFQYTYSAPTEEERKQIESIRKQYVEQKATEEKTERIRMLDRKVKTTANAVALSVGIFGTLVFGTGMSMVLEWSIFLGGILVSLVGSVCVALAYPIYQAVLRKNKKKYGEEILRLSEEVLGDTQK